MAVWNEDSGGHTSLCPPYHLIPARRRLDEAAIVSRADQNFIHADPRRHARDKGDGAAAILGLKHLRLLGLARRHWPRFQDRGRDLAQARSPLMHSSMLKEWVSASTACFVVV